MIYKWKRYIRESSSENDKNDISIDMLHEIAYFRAFSLHDYQVAKIWDTIDEFYSLFDLDVDDLMPMDVKGYYKLHTNLEKIFKICLTSSVYSDMLKEIYLSIRKNMSLFPPFYEIEDLFLSIKDDNWYLSYEYKNCEYLYIILDKESITIEEYLLTINKCKNILKRMSSITNREFRIFRTRYDINPDDKSESHLSIVLY